MNSLNSLKETVGTDDAYLCAWLLVQGCDLKDIETKAKRPYFFVEGRSITDKVKAYQNKTAGNSDLFFFIEQVKWLESKAKHASSKDAVERSYMQSLST